jgi:hypothetical protein
MAETDEKDGRATAAGRDATGGSDAAGGEEEAELRAEEESAKAMEAEVPHPPGYEDPGQEPPADSGEGRPA